MVEEIDLVGIVLKDFDEESNFIYSLIKPAVAVVTASPSFSLPDRDDGPPFPKIFTRFSKRRRTIKKERESSTWKKPIQSPRQTEENKKNTK
jgi:hypothetical protein